VRQAGAGTWQFLLLTLAGLFSLGVLLAVAGRALFKLFEVPEKDSEGI
jgi:hypothetical protein